MRFDRPTTLFSVTLAAAALCSANLLTGCAAGNLSTASSEITDGKVAIAVRGNVHGGQNPVGGSVVQLWETGTTGYGTGAAQLVASTTTSAGSGSFSFPTANVSANCVSGPTAYVTAFGGDPSGATTNNLNTGLLLAAIVGPCATTGASTSINVNEVTTVAAAYALSGFAVDTAGSVTIGAPATNAVGLADAVANAALLASPVTGTANASSATVLLPTAALNTIANTLAACVNTNSTSTALSTACSTLYGDTTPPGGSAPTDTFQAALNLAHYPGLNTAALVNLSSAVAPFQPTLPAGNGTTTAQNDLSLGIAYPNATLATASAAPGAIAIDKTDNLWILGATNGTSNYITEQTSASAGSVVTNNLPSSLPSTQNVRWGAFDPSNNLWLSDGAGLTVYNGGNSTPVAQSFSTLGTGSTAATPATLDANNYVLAIDGAGNVFTATYGAQGNCVPATVSAATTVCDLVELTKGTSSYTPTDTFGGNYLSTPSVRGMFADANTNAATAPAADKGNVWITSYGVLSATKGASTTAGNTIEIYTPGSASTNNAAGASGLPQNTLTVGPTGAGLWGIGLDNSSNAYVVASTLPALYFVPVADAAATTTPATITGSVTANAITGIPSATAAPSASTVNGGIVGGLSTPSNVAIDGAGNVFVNNAGFGTVVEYSPASSAYVSPYFGFSPTVLASRVAETINLATAKFSLAKNATSVTFTSAANAFNAGDQVTLSGFTNANLTSLNGLTLPVLSSSLSGTSFAVAITYSGSAVASTTVGAGSAAAPAYGPELLTCSSTACSLPNAVINSSNATNGIAIDRAGSVWTMNSAGTLVELLGTAYPTNPVAAAGQYGVKP